MEQTKAEHTQATRMKEFSSTIEFLISNFPALRTCHLMAMNSTSYLSRQARNIFSHHTLICCLLISEDIPHFLSQKCLHMTNRSAETM